MANAPQVPLNANMLLSPAEPTPGALGVFAKFGDLEEVRQLEIERDQQVWEVRAVLSDNVPLSGDADAALSRPEYHMLHLNPNEDPLWIYLHSGGRNAVYYELVGGPDHKVIHIAVRVESRLPSNALLLARRPLNALLDVFTRDSNMPLLIERLELISPRTGRVLITEMLLLKQIWSGIGSVRRHHAVRSLRPLRCPLSRSPDDMQPILSSPVCLEDVRGHTTPPKVDQRGMRKARD